MSVVPEDRNKHAVKMSVVCHIMLLKSYSLLALSKCLVLIISVVCCVWCELNARTGQEDNDACSYFFH